MALYRSSYFILHSIVSLYDARRSWSRALAFSLHICASVRACRSCRSMVSNFGSLLPFVKQAMVGVSSGGKSSVIAVGSAKPLGKHCVVVFFYN
ncbi:hypothetical protein M3J09_009066 [Ascochyta lentis]